MLACFDGAGYLEHRTRIIKARVFVLINSLQEATSHTVFLFQQCTYSLILIEQYTQPFPIKKFVKKQKSHVVLTLSKMEIQFLSFTRIIFHIVTNSFTRNTAV